MDKFAKQVEQTKEDHWYKWLENANSNELWNVNRFLQKSPTDFGKESVPALQKKDGTIAKLTSVK
jgi:hypothetical protein